MDEQQHPEADPSRRVPVTVEIRRLDAAEARAQLDGLAAVLADCVEGGASVSYMAPFSHADARAAFEAVVADVEQGRRVLLAAFDDGELVGTVQVNLATPPNQPHRGDIAKLLVRRSARRRGIAAQLMEAAEREALAEGKTLLVLDTVTGDAAERLYERLGWTRVGVIPNYALYPDGRPCATTVFYKQLGVASARRMRRARVRPARLTGNSGRLFADPQPTPDETSFQVDNTSKRYFDSPYYKRHSEDLQPVPKPTSSAAAPRPRRRPRARRSWTRSRSEAHQLPRRRRHRRGEGEQFQTAAKAIAQEASVADAMATTSARRPRRPGVLLPPRRRRLLLRRGPLLLRPVLRAVPRATTARSSRSPAITTGWSSATQPDTPKTPTLTAFLRNFCARSAGAVAGRRHDRPDDDDAAGRLLHARRAVRLDHRPLHERARRARA